MLFIVWKKSPNYKMAARNKSKLLIQIVIEALYSHAGSLIET
jgi:hypothetical protein